MLVNIFLRSKDPRSFDIATMEGTLVAGMWELLYLSAQWENNGCKHTADTLTLTPLLS